MGVTKNPYNIGGGLIGQPNRAPLSTPGLIAKGAPQEALKSWLTPATQVSRAYDGSQGTQEEWFKRFRDATNSAGAGAAPTLQQNPSPTIKRSGGGGGGGGGGGAAPAPTLTQDQLNWYASLLKGTKPGDLQYNAIDLPDWQDVNITPFDNSMYENLRGSLAQAGASDRAAASGAYDQLQNYLQSNYSNPYANATYATSENVPGQTQLAMKRMLESQGQNQNMSNDTYRQGQSADQGFGNLLSILGSNEDVAQRNRLSAVQADRGTTNRALDMALLSGNTGIGLQEGAAKQGWQQRADDRGLLNAQQRSQISQQEALANWQRQNQVGDTNVANNMQYREGILGQLTNLLPLLTQAGGLTLPDLAALGLA